MGGGGYEDEEQETPLLQNSSHNHMNTGTVWTALAHIITGVIGSGVLSLAWSMAQLGWIGGPLSLLLFAFFTLVSAYFISDVHIYSNPNTGNTTVNQSYLQAVHTILGYKNGLVCGCLVYFSIFKTGVVYTITSSISMRAIRQSNCYHEEGHEAACEFNDTYYMLMFGMVQIIASQIPNIFHTKWLSIIASIMSFTYSFIGMGLGLAQVIAKGKVEGSISGISTTNPTQKVWLAAQALGDIAFSYTFSLILLEIQSTLKSPPSQKVTMKKASTIAVFTTTIFYVCCGGFGYAAFGDLTPGNLLTGFGFYEPYWLVDFGNACIVLHLVGGYQIYSQTLFAIVERWYAEKFPQSAFAKDVTSLKVSLLPEFRINPLRLCFRTTYVVLTMAVGMLFPYFNEVVAFAGSVIFWPLTIYFPVEMYFVQKKVVPWSGKWIVLRIYTAFCLFVTVFTLAGSIEGLIAKRFG
ncbi:putative amino acid transporter, transmembrane domain-containing protein [Helianthus annuus]|nr:putative amino acid transporter, transmembrane domain-containing protein [Helianthus annuus]KAJ0902547.1 putative amino acid transporter, transmembrane domain-containing protein [Helianthus annuus]